MSIVITLLRFGFAVLSLALWSLFLLRIFAPGTAETAFFFRFTTQTVQPYLEQAGHWATLPIQWLLHHLEGFLPPEARLLFPILPAGSALNLLAGLLLSIPGLSGTGFGQALSRGDYLPLFPGVIDWRLPLAWFFWRWVEAFLLMPLENFRKLRYKRQKEQQMAKLDELIRQSYSSTPHVMLETQDTASGTLLTNMAHQLKDGLNTLPVIGNVDPLTRLLHQRVFLRHLEQALESTKKTGGYLAIITADIDNLGVLNELHGRIAGDAALREISGLFSQLATPQGNALACRMEGGKLALMLTQTSPDAAHRIAKLLCSQTEALRLKDFPNVRLSASFGVYVAHFTPGNGSFSLTAQEMLTKADGQLYKAKRSGKNQVAVGLLM